MTVPGSLYTPLIRKIRSSGHIIEGSGLPNGSSGYLSKTFGSAGDSNKIFTFSYDMWITV